MDQVLRSAYSLREGQLRLEIRQAGTSTGSQTGLRFVGFVSSPDFEVVVVSCFEITTGLDPYSNSYCGESDLSKNLNRAKLGPVDFIDSHPTRRAFEEASQSSSKARFGTGKVLPLSRRVEAEGRSVMVFEFRAVLQWRLRHEARGSS